ARREWRELVNALVVGYRFLAAWLKVRAIAPDHHCALDGFALRVGYCAGHSVPAPEHDAAGLVSKGSHCHRLLSLQFAPLLIADILAVRQLDQHLDIVARRDIFDCPTAGGIGGRLTLQVWMTLVTPLIPVWI